MSGRGLLIFLIGVIGIAGTIFISLFRFSNLSSENITKAYYRQMANNIAQSGANMALRQLANNSSWRSGYSNKSMLGGKCTVRIADTTYKGNPVIKIVSVGIMSYKIKDWETNGTSITDTTSCFVIKGFMPATVKAAITTNNPVETKGNLTVDGRNHSVTGTLIEGSGTLGIWTTKTLDQSGASTIGGTSLGADFTPKKNANSSTYKTGQTWPGGYPSTPDGILGGISGGYPEGTLKAIAQSKAKGSQYTTNPSSLTYPLKGITYVELPSGSTWQSMDIQGSGILIVHNSACNAIMKNINSGTFTGLIIADDLVHVHADIIGAIIGLSASPSEGNCIGNGNGTVMYSSEAIINATGSAFSSSSNKGSSSNVLTWIE